VGDQALFGRRYGRSHLPRTTTGEVAWRQRLAGQFGASPVTTADRIYLFDQRERHGVTAVGGEPLAVNKLDEGCHASPAAVDGALFLRGNAHLYCISEACEKQRCAIRGRR